MFRVSLRRAHYVPTPTGRGLEVLGDINNDGYLDVVASTTSGIGAVWVIMLGPDMVVCW